MKKGRQILKVFASFLGVNLLAILPVVLLALSKLPWVLSVEIDASTEPPLSIRATVSGVTCREPDLDHSASGSQLYLTTLEPFDRMSLGMNYSAVMPQYAITAAPAFSYLFDETNTFTITAIRMTVGDLFTRTVDLRDFASQYEIKGGSKLVHADETGIVVDYAGNYCTFLPKENGRLTWNGWRLSPNGFIFPVFLPYYGFSIEVLLLLLCGWRTRRNRDAAVIRLAPSFLLAGLCAVYFIIVLPMQSFAANPGDYSFGAWALVKDVLPTAAEAFVVCLVGLLLSQFAFGLWVHFLLLAVVFFLHLQVGILSHSAPAMNGDIGYYDNMSLVLRDASVFLVVLAAGIGLAWKKPKCVYIVFGCAGILLDSLLNMGNAKSCSESSQGIRYPDIAGIGPRGDVPKYVAFSKQRNVLVFVLDSLTTEVVGDILKNEEPIAKAMSGFTCFKNNIGAQSESTGATFNIFSARRYTRTPDGRASQSMIDAVFAPGTVLDDLVRSDCPLYFMPPEDSVGFGLVLPQRTAFSDLGRRGATDRKKCRPVFEKDDYSIWSFSLAEICWFRLSPFYKKADVFKKLFTYTLFGRLNETTVYAPLLDASVVDAASTFCYLHTWGAHVPHDVDRNGNRSAIMMGGYRSYYEHACFALGRLAELLENLRRKGVYDNSYIIVLADHGSHSMGDTKSPKDYEPGMLPLRAYPMLLVKPIGARATVAFDDETPTWHGNLYKLLKAVQTNDLDIAQTRDILRERRRVFLTPERDLCERWIIDEQRKVVEYRRESADVLAP